MREKDFKDLLQSIKEMKLIMAGKLKPARVTKFSAAEVKKIRASVKKPMKGTM